MKFHHALFLGILTIVLLKTSGAEAIERNYSKNGWEFVSLTAYLGMPTQDLQDFNAWIDDSFPDEAGGSVSYVEPDYEWGLRLGYDGHWPLRLGLGYSRILASGGGTFSTGEFAIEVPTSIIDFSVLYLLAPEGNLNFGLGMSLGWAKVFGSFDGSEETPEGIYRLGFNFKSGGVVFSGFAEGEYQLGRAGAICLEGGYRANQLSEVEVENGSTLRLDGSGVKLSCSGFFIRAGLRLNFHWLEFG